MSGLASTAAALVAPREAEDVDRAGARRLREWPPVAAPGTGAIDGFGQGDIAGPSAVSSGRASAGAATAFRRRIRRPGPGPSGAIPPTIRTRP